MNRYVQKNLLREIGGSLGRFMAILAIIALGSGFFAGLRAAKPAMVEMADGYADEYKLFDYRLLSTLGFVKEDVEAVAAADGVLSAEGACEVDFLCSVNGAPDVVLRAHSIMEGINLPELKGGRLPESPNECVADARWMGAEDIGSVIRVSEENDEDALDMFVYGEYTVVGIADSPYYMNFERGNASLGSGRVAAFVYMPRGAFDAAYYTDIFVMLSGTEGLDLYSGEYEDAAEAMEHPLEKLAKERAGLRYLDVYGDAKKELNDARAELNDARREYESEKADALKELEDARVELADARAEIDDGWNEFRTGKADGEKELADAKAELDDGYAELTDGQKKYDDGLTEYTHGLAEYYEGREQYERGLARYEDGLAQYEDGLAQYEKAKARLDRGRDKLKGAEAQLAAYRDQHTQLTQLYALVSGMAAARGTTNDALVSELETALQYQDIDSGAAAAVAAMDAMLASYGMTTASLTSAWRTAEASIVAAGYGTAPDQAALDAMDAAISAGEADYSEGYNQYQGGRNQLRGAKKQLDESKELLDEAALELADAEKKLADAGTELADAEQELIDAASELEDGWNEYNDGLKEYNDGVETFNTEIADAYTELSDAEAEYLDGVADYNEGRAEAEEEFAKAERELKDAAGEIADGEKELLDLEHPTVYVLDRATNAGYSNFKNDTQIVSDISTIFPLFFFLVAALVCITTMTRMVDEERTQIGVFKALGYSSVSIMSKYLIYSNSAAFIGCVVGFMLGSWALPAVIWDAYKIMYDFSDVGFYFNTGLFITSVAAYLACSSLTTLWACRAELRVVPAELIRPKVMKVGRKILLERVGILWKKLSFLAKVALRNVMRYRQRLFMMVLGIGGCTALLLAGFGLRDSIQDIVHYQFDEITVYDYAVTFTDPMDGEGFAAFMGDLNGGIKDGMLLHIASVDMDAGDETKSAYLIMPEKGNVEGFVNLHDGEENLVYPGLNDALICRNLAEACGLKAGDTFSVRDGDLRELTLTVFGVFDQYAYNYVYISAETCLDQWGYVPDMKSAYLNAADGEDLHLAAAAVLKQDVVSNIIINADTKATVGNTLSRLDRIVLMVVACAGALAFIVLYNLTNINITERIREIATIKVLGFRPWETMAYVLRENLMLTAMGGIAGLMMGKGLHAYIMSQIKIDMMYFPIVISPPSYLIALGLTFAFAWAVNFSMYFKLARINMAESLKSVE